MVIVIRAPSVPFFVAIAKSNSAMVEVQPAYGHDDIEHLLDGDTM